MPVNKTSLQTQDFEDETELQYPLAFYEYENFMGQHVDLDQVLSEHRPYPVAITIQNSPEEAGLSFEDATIRIHIENYMPTFTLSCSNNPNNSSNSKNFRKLTLAFGAQVFDVTVLEGGNSFRFKLEDPSLIVFSTNTDAPTSLLPSPLEEHLKSDLSLCKIWTVTAHPTNNERLLQWGVGYWFAELSKCRKEFPHLARQWATNFMMALKKEEKDACNSREPVEVSATFRCINEAALAENSDTQARIHFSFRRSQSSSFKPGTIVAIAGQDTPLSQRAPRPIMNLKASDHMDPGNRWVGLILNVDDSTAVVTCLLLHSPRDRFPDDSIMITVQCYHSNSELSKSILVRAHAYFKCVGPEIAVIESQGVNRAEHAVMRHNIHIPSLIFPHIDLPAERTTATQGFDVSKVPQSKRTLNSAQAEAINTCAVTAGRMAIINGPPGTGKSLLLSKIISLAMISGIKVLVNTSANKPLDVLLRKTLSTFGNEKPADFQGHPRIVRIVAPSRTQTELLVSLASDSSQEADEYTKQFDLAYQRVELAKSLNTPDSKNFLKLHENYLTNGYISDRADAREYLRIMNHFDNELLGHTTVLFATTSMASYKAILNRFRAAWVINDESCSIRHDQSLNSILWQPNLTLWVQAGDPLQLPPFVFDRQDNSLGTSLHKELLDRGFAGHTQLVEQHRSEENLVKFVNDRFYGGILTTSDAVKAGRPQYRCLMEILASKKPKLPNGCIITGNNMFFDIANGFGEEDSYSSTKNEAEAQFTIDLARTLITAGVSPKSILIIAPYTAHVQLIREKLAVAKTSFQSKDVAVHTIDSTQGDESDIVILTLARGGPSARVGFIVEDPRLIVALSRAKYARYVVGNMRFFQRSRQEFAIKDFISQMEEDKLVFKVFVQGAPKIPGRSDPSGAGKSRRERAPRPDPEPLRELDPVEVPTELPAAQILASQFFTENDANDY
jgi:hypothetical protein